MTSLKLRTTVEHILRHLPKPSNQKQVPLFVGLCGPQGSGMDFRSKTTLTQQIATELQSPPYNLKVVSFSVDDLYLPFERQLKVASSNPGNRLLQYRGNAGTHDVTLGQKTFATLLKAHNQFLQSRIVVPVPIPQYNKASKNGRGDQVPIDQWPKVLPPYDVILFEGWMLGFKPLSEQDLKKAYYASPDHSHVRKFDVQEIVTVNEYLRLWEKQIYPYLDVFIHIDTEDINFVYDWRWEQEEHLRRLVNNPDAGLTREEVQDFVDRFMPSYELYLPRLRKENVFVGLPELDNSVQELKMSHPETRGRHLKLQINKSRDMSSSMLVNLKNNL
ncbi:hypothetical protein K7432_002639 [Basidiobolus ranarum]|uniref:P-loop containing nucleoside triphosphate hydrolase protein n=1 Tax=Basidiobolus ranarum TaxID=34480 RepID=A0ABR2W7G1_9FUNG